MNHPYLYEYIVSAESLFYYWDQFKRGKRSKKEIQIFARYLEDNIFQLHEELASFQYQHGPYRQFRVFDPKERCISAASVKDRLVHQMVYETLTQIFDSQFIFHTFSNRLGKGVHQGILHMRRMTRKVSHNNQRCCYALKMDIRRYFDTMNHKILKELIRKKCKNFKLLSLIDMIIDSFKINNQACGVPLGNVTSQIFSNIYLQPLDDFIKHVLKQPYYLRYCDDFVILSHDRSLLGELIEPIGNFLSSHLLLQLHPKKTILRKLSEGIDFLGYIVFSHHMLLRTKTKRRVKKGLEIAHTQLVQGNITPQGMDQRLQSYLGILSHANQHTFSEALKNTYWIRPAPWE